MSLNVVSVIGARPQFIKSAIVSISLKKHGIIEHVIHSGQHYDHEMSGRFLEELGIVVDHNLNVGSGDHARQTAQIMINFNEYLDSLNNPPDAILVYGDTNSTLGAALVASKLEIPLIHIEAGLRSYNRSMPEEVNRVLTDHISDLLLCSSDVGKNNLETEGVVSGVHVVGDVMYDAFKHFTEQNKNTQVLSNIFGNDHPHSYILMTLHRPGNTDNPNFITKLCEVIRGLGQTIVWPVHPRFRSAVEAADIPENVRLINPVGYFEMLDLLKSCTHIITDSGGLQKEAYWAMRPCITLRPETEWVETLNGGWNVLADLDSNLQALLKRRPTTGWTPLYGDGKACDRIAEIITKHIATNT